MTHFTAFYKCFVKFFSFCGWWRCTIMVREREERISYWTCLSTFGHIGDDDPFIPIDSYKELFSNIKLIMYSLLSLFVNWLMKRKTGEQNRLIVQVIYSGLCSKRTTRVQGFPVCHMTSTLSFEVYSRGRICWRRGRFCWITITRVIPFEMNKILRSIECGWKKLNFMMVTYC